MHAGIVDQDLNRRLRDQSLKDDTTGFGVGHVEGDGLSRATCPGDLFRQRCCLGPIPISVDIDVTAVSGQPSTDRRTDAAAAAGDEGAFHVVLPQLRRIQHYGDATAQQQALPGGNAEAIEDGVVVAGEALGLHDQIGIDVIQSCNMQFDPARAGEITGAGRRIGSRQQGAMGSHGLGGIFDAAGGPQPAMGAQGIIRGAVARRRAADALGIPGIDVVQQAHAALVRDVGKQPGTV